MTLATIVLVTGVGMAIAPARPSGATLLGGPGCSVSTVDIRKAGPLVGTAVVAGAAYVDCASTGVRQDFVGTYVSQILLDIHRVSPGPDTICYRGTPTPLVDGVGASAVASTCAGDKFKVHLHVDLWFNYEQFADAAAAHAYCYKQPGWANPWKVECYRDSITV